jgi:uncharacterized protein (TIGR03083 family)
MAEAGGVRYSKSYRDLRIRVADLIRAASPEAFDGPSPATPGWRVHDVLSHLVGVTDDVINGRLEGVATDSWTAGQVDPRRARTAVELLDEWEATAEQFEAVLDTAPPEMIGQGVFDAVTHEHDIRCALQAPGARDSDAFDIAWDWLIGARSRFGGEPIMFVTERGEVVAGAGEPSYRVEAPRFELFRATVGRRSTDEIARYGWDPEPNATLLLAGPIFAIRATPLDE